MFEVAGEQQQASVLGQRRYRNISKTGMTAFGLRCVRDLPCESGGPCIQRQDAIGVGGQQTVQPAVEAVSPLGTTGAAQFANALRHFGHGNGR